MIGYLPVIFFMKIVIALLSLYFVISANALTQTRVPLPLGNFHWGDGIVCYLPSQDHPYAMGIVKKDGKYGIATRQGELITPLIYEDGKCLNHQHATMKQNGFWGVIRANNEVVLNFAFNEPIWDFNGVDKFVVRHLEKGQPYSAIFASPNHWVVGMQAGQFRFWGKNYLIVTEAGNKYGGVIDTNGKKLFWGRYPYLKPLTDNLLSYERDRKKDETGSWYRYRGIIQADGTVVLEDFWHNIELLDKTVGDERFLVSYPPIKNYDRQWLIGDDTTTRAMIDRHRNILAMYRYITPFDEQGLAKAYTGEQTFAIIDRYGRVIVTPQKYQYPPWHSERGYEYRIRLQGDDCTLYLTDEQGSRLNFKDYPDITCTPLTTPNIPPTEPFKKLPAVGDIEPI